MSVDEQGLPQPEKDQESTSVTNTPPEEEVASAGASPQADVNVEESSEEEEEEAMSNETANIIEEEDPSEPIMAAAEPAAEADAIAADDAMAPTTDVPPSEAEENPMTEAHAEAPPVPEATTPTAPTAEGAEEATEAPKATRRIINRAKEAGIQRGDVIEGVINNTSPTQITVDLRDGIQGIITGRELERMTRKTLDELQEGAPVTVFVVNENNQDGNVILSISRAQEELDWLRAEQFRQDQTIYEDKIAGYNKGGLIVRFGLLRGFVPQSQIGDDRRRLMPEGTPQEMYSSMVNQDIVVRVMEVDRGRNRLILSERAATRERRERRKAALIEELAVGQVMEGRVVSLEDFGAFVDIGGAEGLVHLTEISWSHVNHPKEALNVGQIVRVEVISVDRRRKRIGLSVKRQEADPWDEIATTYQVGDLVQGTITKLTKFGAFAQLVDAAEIEGLVHISELSDQRVQHPREVVNEGEKLTLRVVKIDVTNRRLGLSLKKVNSAEYLDRDLATFAQRSETPDGDDAAEAEAAATPDLQTQASADAALADETAPQDENYVDYADYDEDDVPSASDVDVDDEDDVPSASDVDVDDEGEQGEDTEDTPAASSADGGDADDADDAQPDATSPQS